MTTIVYDHENKKIACDSRESAHGQILKDTADKFYIKKDAVWFICGGKCDAEIFIGDFEHNKESMDNLGCSGVFVKNGEVYTAAIEDGVYKSSLVDYNEGFGSGGWLALAAVDLGKTAEEAVKYAMTRDAFTGGKVRVYDIKKGEFIK